ncbi:MAG TPA: hypothetical protein DDY77_06030 [Clostridiales bacterium]|nr:hypothetical protein [Clostridiales bacterium]
MLKVSKFGGSSLATLERLNNVLRIVKEDKRRKIVVVSAPGKGFCSEEKTTDFLRKVFKINDEKEKEQSLNFLARKFAEYSEDESIFAIAYNAFLACVNNEQAFISRGEYLTALVVAKKLGFVFKDALELIFFDGNGEVDRTKCRAAAEKTDIGDGVVVPGFYGADEQGKVRLFPRGGGDITGAVLSEAFGVAMYENFTDEEGVLSADPRIFAKAKTVKKLNYREIETLSRFGAKVVCPSVAKYLVGKDIPLVVRSSFSPSSRFTLVSEAACGGKDKPKAVAGKFALKISVKLKIGGLSNIFIALSKLFTFLGDPLALYLSTNDLVFYIDEDNSKIPEAIQALRSSSDFFITAEDGFFVLSLVGSFSQTFARQISYRLNSSGIKVYCVLPYSDKLIYIVKKSHSAKAIINLANFINEADRG